MNHLLPLSDFLLRPLVEAALAEDIRSGDLTTQALIPVGTTASATMIAREDGVLCGVALARLAFHALDPSARIQMLAEDGSALSVAVGGAILTVQGSAQAILTAERVALNFVQRLSGIATLTRSYVEAVEGTQARIADTRKTTPGLRVVEKYAVRCGGGFNHRYALDDMILIKDNHIALCGGINRAIERARAFAGHSVKVEIECDTLSQAEEAAQAHADIILLDNISPDDLQEAANTIRSLSPRTVVEASGGITLQTAQAKARSGVGILSIGALTHSAKSLDIGLDIDLHF